MDIVHDEMAERPRARIWRQPEYVRLVESGLLGSDEDLELVDGEILVKKREGPRHRAALGQAQRLLEGSFGVGFWVRVDAPIVLDDTAMPDPDLAVVTGAPSDYWERHPHRAELVVEISDSSRAFDLGQKQRMYARSGQPDFWCVDLIEESLWIHRVPGPRGYKSIARCERGETVTPLGGRGSIAVADFFAPIVSTPG